MPKPRALNDSEIELVCDQIASGCTLREAAKYALDTLGKRVAFNTLQSYPEVQKALGMREQLQRIETREAIQKSHPKMVDGIIDIMSDILRRRGKLADQLDELQLTDPRYKLVADQLSKLDKNYLAYSDKLNDFNEKASVQSGSPLANRNEAAERLQRVNDLLGTGDASSPVIN